MSEHECTKCPVVRSVREECGRLLDEIDGLNARGVETADALLRCMRERVGSGVHAELLAERDDLRRRVAALTDDLIVMRHLWEHSGPPSIVAGPIDECRAVTCVEATQKNPLLSLLVPR